MGRVRHSYSFETQAGDLVIILIAVKVVVGQPQGHCVSISHFALNRKKIYGSRVFCMKRKNQKYEAKKLCETSEEEPKPWKA
jgi:hypothetical protein